MINDIRKYIDEQIKLVDSELIAWENDLFGNNDQSKPRAEKYYNLAIGNNSPTRDGNSFWDNIEITLDIYSGESRDLIGAFDALYDKALEIKNCIINPEYYLNNYRFNDIEVISMLPNEQLDNDNSLWIRIEFIIRKNYL